MEINKINNNDNSRQSADKFRVFRFKRNPKNERITMG